MGHGLITPDGSLMQRVEGKTRKTWKFNDLAKDRARPSATPPRWRQRRRRPAPRRR